MLLPSSWPWKGPLHISITFLPYKDRFSNHSSHPIGPNETPFFTPFHGSMLPPFLQIRLYTRTSSPRKTIQSYISRQPLPPKRVYLLKKLHGVTTHRTTIWSSIRFSDYNCVRNSPLHSTHPALATWHSFRCFVSSSEIKPFQLGLHFQMNNKIIVRPSARVTSQVLLPYETVRTITLSYILAFSTAQTLLYVPSALTLHSDHRVCVICFV